MTRLLLVFLAACGGTIAPTPPPPLEDAGQSSQDAPGQADPLPNAPSAVRPTLDASAPALECQPWCCLDALWFQCGTGTHRERCDEHPEVALCERGACTAGRCQ